MTTNTLHALYTLADYPVLASLAAQATTATRLDGRACLHLYTQALTEIDIKNVTPSEKVLMLQLGVYPKNRYDK